MRSRADEVQDLLAEDLDCVERALQAVMADCVPPTDAVTEHLVSRGGKRARPVTLLLSSACFGSIPPAAKELAVVVELVHSATLLHDDVVDDGLVRRGAATSRRLWGNGMSVLGGDLLLVRSLSRTLEACPQALPELMVTLEQLVEGEIVQMRGRSELDVSEAAYERVLRGKTASLFVWAAAAGGRVGGATPTQREALGRFGEGMGMAFQMVDDVLDYTAGDSGKTLLADLCEGKLTLPLVLAVRERPELMDAVRRIHAGDREPVAQVSEAVIQSGACDDVRRRAERHTDDAVEALEQLPDSPARELLAWLARQLTDRTR